MKAPKTLGWTTLLKAMVTASLFMLLAAMVMAPFLSRADDAKKDKKPYPLTTCVVSGDKLGGDMGDPYIYTYKDKKKKDDPGREVQFCCKSCVAEFEKAPAKYLKKLDEAEAKAKAKK